MPFFKLKLIFRVDFLNLKLKLVCLFPGKVREGMDWDSHPKKFFLFLCLELC